MLLRAGARSSRGAGVRQIKTNRPIRRRLQHVPPGAYLVPRPPISHPPAPHLGPPTPVHPPLSRTRSARHAGQVLWQERTGTPVLLLVVTTRRDPGQVLGATPSHFYGAAPVPRPPLPAPEARHGVQTLLQTQEVSAVTVFHLLRLPPAAPDDLRGPRALSPAPDSELWCHVWAQWLARLPPQCQWMTTGPSLPRGNRDNRPPPYTGTTRHNP